MKSLTRKLILYCSILLLVVCGCIGVFGYISSSNAVMEEVNTSLEHLAVQGANTVEKAIEAQTAVLERFAINDKIKNPNISVNDKIAELLEEVERVGHVRMGIADINGSLTNSDGEVSDIKDRQYFKDAVAGNVAVSDPIISKVDSSVLFPIAVPIKNHGTIIGVLVAFKDGNDLSKITDEIVFGETGRSFIIRADGTTIAHTDRELVLNMDNTIENAKNNSELVDLAEIHKKMIDGQRGYGTYSYKGEVKHMGYAPVEGTDWSLGVAALDSEVKDGVNELRMQVIAISIISLLAGAIVFFIIASKIVNPLKKLVKAADGIAEGDLNIAVDVKTKDELGRLADAFRKMADNLNGTITSINDASEQVSSAARQVSDSSMALSQGATEQASSIEELTASLEEISSQTKLNADKANEANSLSVEAKSNAINGNARMNEMLRAMEEINEASSNISKIIKVIDDIAFQTNILALNAAVEAARAGQHGKGFAVVAEEVRNLAARSANAARETTDMIEGSIKKSEGGTKIANATADALSSIVEDVTKVADLVNDITIASNEQALGIEQINQGIMQVSQVVQTNSATSEEAAAASEELASQAELLKNEVSSFRLKKTYRASSYKRIEDVNPDVLRLLDQMNDRSSSIKQAASKEIPEVKTAKKPVKEEKPNNSLSDSEFGKY